MSADSLRFLADESFDHRIVRALRDAGFDVVALSEITRRSVDQDVIEQAARDGRILLTEDKDFGWLYFVSRARSAGVVFIRYPGDARAHVGEAVVQVVRDHGERLIGNFTVIQPGIVRISRRLPLDG